MSSGVSSLGWPSTVPMLTDGWLTLRGWTACDADSVLAACQDADTQRWMDVPVPYLPEHAADFVGEHSRQQWSSQQGAPFAITATEDAQVLGSCGLVGVTAKHLVGEVVYAVAPWARPQGRPAGRATTVRLGDDGPRACPAGDLRRTVECRFASCGCPTRGSVRRGPPQQGADSRHSKGHGALRAPQVGIATERGRPESRRIMREASE
jgi:hypothetical protein